MSRESLAKNALNLLNEQGQEFGLSFQVDGKTQMRGGLISIFVMAEPSGFKRAAKAQILSDVEEELSSNGKEVIFFEVDKIESPLKPTAVRHSA
jgi:hypothetical protein